MQSAVRVRSVGRSLSARKQGARRSSGAESRVHRWPSADASAVSLEGLRLGVWLCGSYGDGLSHLWQSYEYSKYEQMAFVQVPLFVGVL
jgi:hypothetical protein